MKAINIAELVIKILDAEFFTACNALKKGQIYFAYETVGWRTNTSSLSRSERKSSRRAATRRRNKSVPFIPCAHYVDLNPVRARIVDRPEDYAWSSYRARTGLCGCP
jgi:hypothetical protein